MPSKSEARPARRLPATLVVLVCAVIAVARSVEEVLPGQKLWGELGSSEELTVVLRVVGGTELGVTAKAWKGSNLRPRLALRDEDGEVVDIDAHLKGSKKGNKVSIKNLPLEAGAYSLSVLGEVGTSGGFDLLTSSQLPARAKGGGDVTVAGTRVAVHFDANPGDVVQLKVKGQKKGTLSPVIERLVEEDGTETAIGEPKRSPRLTVAGAGRHRFEVGGADDTTGAFAYVLKIRRAKPPKDKRDLRDVNARGSVTGRIVLDGDVTRDAQVGKVAGAEPVAHADSVLAGEIIVAAAPGATRAHVLDAIAEEVPSLHVDVAAEMTADGPWLLRVPSLSQGSPDARRRRQTLTLVEAFARAPALAYAEPNRRVHVLKTPNDLRYSEQYDLKQMNLPKAWDLETGDPGIVVAIVDTGIWSHPDLDLKAVQGYDFVSDPASSQDGNGIDSDPTDTSRNFHGTHVAGTVAAATGNGIGIAGVAWGCRFQPVRVLGKDGYGSWFDIAAGVRWAAGLPVSGAPLNMTPARVMNLSLGGPVGSQTLQSAVAEAHARGAVIVAAAGNSQSSAPEYPAAYPGVISVYALDANFHWASYSNWGATISLGAPGGDLNAGLPGILSTFVDGALQPTYTQLQGTSMASPHVAGVAALLLSADPLLSPDEVHAILKDTAVDLGPPGFDVDYGDGAVDAYAALREVAGPPAAPATLRFWPSVLEFGRLTDTRVVHVRNEGSGTVTITGVSTTTSGGGPWLSAVAGGSTVPTTISVTVDHEQLYDGTFEGSVIVDTSIGQASLPVRVTRVPPPSLGVVRVKALGPGGQVLASTTTSEAKDWQYSLDGLALGTYTIAAEADLDDDLLLTRIDEFEGRWPLLDRPETIDVATSDLDHASIDVPLLRRDMQFQFDGVGGGRVGGALAARVFDASTGLPVVGAAVFLGDGQVAGETDLNGRVALAGSFSGPQTVSVVADGFVTRTRMGADGQYQAFAMEPRAVPQVVRVEARVTDMPATSSRVVVHVGETRADATWSGGTEQTLELDVPRSRPAEAVSAIVYDSADRPVAAGLDSVTLTGGGPVAVALAVAPPAGGARGRVVDAALPPATFTSSGATLESLVTVRLDRDQWVPIGWSPVPVEDPTTVWWASLIDLDPPLEMRFDTRSTDVNGRFARRAFVGDTAIISVERPMSLPEPGMPTLPAGGALVGTVGMQLQLLSPGYENVLEVTLLDDGGRPAWHIVAPGPVTSLALPDLPFGGLESGRAYTWRVELRKVDGLDFDSHHEDDLRGHTVLHTRSVTESFSTE